MNRDQACLLTRTNLNHHGLNDWSVRITTSERAPLGLCSDKDKCIILNALHLDIHPDSEIIDTIQHEIAHALVGCMNGHNDVWMKKAVELGANPVPCSNMSLDPRVIDAIRSGADVAVEVIEESHTVVTRTPKYTITRLQDKCPTCNKVAVEKSSFTVDMTDVERKFILLECGHTIVKDLSKGTPFWSIVEDATEVSHCKHVWDKNECTLCKKHKPFDFQVKGMQFGEQAISFHKGVVIMDDMGLGKTIQALGIIKYHPELWPVLYVVKSGIKFQWFKQILTWLGTEHLCQIFETSNDYIIPNLKGYIIGYDMLVPKSRTVKGKIITQGFNPQRLIDAGIKTIVLDECQQIKNPDSSRTQKVRLLAKHMKVIGLSGTPWKNRASEFFSILNMIAPTKFPSYAGFKKTWVQYKEDPRTGKLKEGGIKNPSHFKDWISDIAIRREWPDVFDQYPKINRTKLYVSLDKDESAVYDESISDFVKWYNQYIIDGTEDQLNGMEILAKLARLRHIVGLAKIPQTIEYVEEFIEDTEKSLLVFVHHKDVGQILYDELKRKLPDIQVLSLTSTLSGEERFKLIQQFNERRSILVASTLASGEGIDGLQKTCSDCIMHERQWNPPNENQAERRLARMGQSEQKINAVYVEASDTVDSDLNGIVESKRKDFHEGMNNSEMESWKETDVARGIADSIVAKFNKRHSDKVMSRMAI